MLPLNDEDTFVLRWVLHDCTNSSATDLEIRHVHLEAFEAQSCQRGEAAEWFEYQVINLGISAATIWHNFELPQPAALGVG